MRPACSEAFKDTRDRSSSAVVAARRQFPIEDLDGTSPTPWTLASIGSYHCGFHCRGVLLWPWGPGFSSRLS
jgi:hypothetical protein